MYTISLTALGSDFLISFRSDRKPIWKLTLSAHRVSLPVRFFTCGSFLCLCSPELFTSLFASSMVGLFPLCIGPRGFTFTWWGCCDHINQPSSPTPFYSVLVSISVYGPFNCISFHKFSRQLSAFSLCSPGLNSALLVLSTIYLFHETLPQP